MSSRSYNQQQSYRNGYRPPQHSPAKPNESQQEARQEPPARDFDEVVEFCKALSLDAEVVGKWIWVTFAQKPNRELIQQLKDFGFRWSPRREKWAHNCGHPCQPGSGDPWDKYEHHYINLADQNGLEDRKRNSYGNQARRYA
jgi:hypothetical protein